MQWSIWWCLMFDVRCWMGRRTMANGQDNMQFKMKYPSPRNCWWMCSRCSYNVMHIHFNGELLCASRWIYNFRWPGCWMQANKKLSSPSLLVNRSNNKRIGSVTNKNMQEWSLYFVRHFNDQINALYSEMFNDLIQSFGWIGTSNHLTDSPHIWCNILTDSHSLLWITRVWYTDFSIKMHE